MQGTAFYRPFSFRILSLSVTECLSHALTVHNAICSLQLLFTVPEVKEFPRYVTQNVAGKTRYYAEYFV